MKIIILLIVLLLILILFISGPKISTFDSRLVLISFYTEGPPVDKGVALTEQKSKFIKRFSPYVDDVKIKSLTDLKDDEWWSKHYKEYTSNDYDTTLCRNEGAEVIGFYKYKALILYRAMQEEPLGTIIFYHDINMSRTTDMGEDAENIRKNANYVLDGCGADIWIGYEGDGIICKYHCKGSAVRALSPKHYEEIFEKRMMIANRIIVRNTPEMRKMFEDEILPAFTHDEYLLPQNDEYSHPEQKWLCCDQSIWNGLLFNKTFIGELPKDWPKYKYTNGRKFSPGFLKEV
jgi:hypothetical protein